MKIRKGYKYQLAEDITFSTAINVPFDIITTRIELRTDGTLLIREGYAFDGPSGPVIDRKTNMSASGKHDALFQLMRMGLLPHKYWRAADCEYGDQMRICGAWEITIKINLAGLKIMKGKYALPENRKKVYTYP